TISAINQNDTRVMLITEWGQGLVTDISGKIVVGPREFPAINSANLPWARDNAEVFYYTNGNGLYKGSIAGNRVRSTLLFRFSGDERAIIPDEEDLSQDGDHLWVLAGPQAFLYTISRNTLGPPVRVGEKDKACGWHKIQITPSNKMLVTWSCNGPGPGRGQEIYAGDGTLNWHMFDNSLHTDTGTDLKGNEIAVVARIPDTYRDACPSGGGIDTIGLNPPHFVSCLVDVNWAPTHISYRDSSHGWVAISFFDAAQCPHYSCFSGPRLAADWQSFWRHFYEEGVVAKIDGSAVHRLVHHRPRSAERCCAASRATIDNGWRY